MTNKERQTVITKINIYASNLADSAKVAYWAEGENNKEWHLREARKSLVKLIELHKSL